MVSQPRFNTESSAARAPSPWWGVHAARYRFAAPYVTDCRTLDVACGTGYGLPLLRTRARWVVGVDAEWEAVRQARDETTENVLVADGCSLPFAEESFDAVTSFETIEHLERRDEFVAELRRVLTRDGLCILSTPNAHVTLPVNGKPHNPYHVHEYTPEELTATLTRQFAHVELLGQKLDARFVISPFWDDQQRLPRTAKNRAVLFLWRALNKLPFSLKNRLSHALWKRPFFPSETDYHFSHTAVETAPVLVALCHNPR